MFSQIENDLKKKKNTSQIFSAYCITGQYSCVVFTTEYMSGRFTIVLQMRQEPCLKKDLISADYSEERRRNALTKQETQRKERLKTMNVFNLKT